MPDINWQIVEVLQNRRKVGQPCASIGYSRIALNADTCDMINLDETTWVEVLKGYNGRKLEKIALKFIKNKTKSSFKITRRIKNGVKIPGGNINSKRLVKELFGENGITQNKRYAITQDNDNKNILIIDLLKEV